MVTGKRFVIDANILFAALIKEGITREILKDKSYEFYAPSWLMKEFIKYQRLIFKKTDITPREFTGLIQVLLLLIKFIPVRSLRQEIILCKPYCPDMKDLVYFALAYRLQIPLWSNDAKLKNQGFIKVVTTQEILDESNQAY